MPYIQGYMRGGRWVRPHFRSGPASGVGALAAVVLGFVLLNGSWKSPAVTTGGAAATVTSVIDGDTIRVRMPDGTAEKVRILGINSPELRRDGKAAQCGAEAAKKALAKRLGGASVALLGAPNQADHDKYKRLLRVVTVDGADVGRAQLVDGHAVVYRAETYAADYAKAVKTAKTTRAGIWGKCR